MRTSQEAGAGVSEGLGRTNLQCGAATTSSGMVPAPDVRLGWILPIAIPLSRPEEPNLKLVR